MAVSPSHAAREGSSCAQPAQLTGLVHCLTDAMLTAAQKSQILRRAGIAVPTQLQMMAGMDDPTTAAPSWTWEDLVDVLFARYAIQRAVQVMQQAEYEGGVARAAWARW